MRNPSSRILKQSVNIYAAIKGQDRAGGPSYSYPVLTQYAVPCTCQPTGFSEIEENGRLTVMRQWRLMFGRDTAAGLRDKIIFTDPAGVSHTLYVQATRDEAGRGMAYSVTATERI